MKIDHYSIQKKGHRRLSIQFSVETNSCCVFGEIMYYELVNPKETVTGTDYIPEKTSTFCISLIPSTEFTS